MSTNELRAEFYRATGDRCFGTIMDGFAVGPCPDPPTVEHEGEWYCTGCDPRPKVTVSTTILGPVFSMDDIRQLLDSGRIDAQDAEHWSVIALDPSVMISPGVVHPTITTADMLEHVRWLARKASP